MNSRLDGTRILVTRPRHQAKTLVRLIEQLNGVALRFPTLAIEPVEQQESIASKLAALDHVHWLIFISANAVNFALKANNGKITRFNLTQIAAVGNATAKVLQDQGLNVDLVPQQGFNSEALLQTAAMQDIRGKRCLIVRGRGGREILAETLRERGAQVDYLEVYQRVMPSVDNTELLELLQHNRLTAVTITSGEALQNLLTMLDDYAPLLFPVPLVVISKRIARIAEKLGFKKIAVSDGPTDCAILQTLITFQRGKQWPK